MVLKSGVGGVFITAFTITALFQASGLVTAGLILATACSCYLLVLNQKAIALAVFSLATIGSLLNAFGTYADEAIARSDNTSVGFSSLISSQCPPYARFFGGDIVASCSLEQQGALSKLSLDSFSAAHLGPFPSLAIATVPQQSPFSGMCEEAIQKLWEACPQVAEVLIKD